MVRYMVHYMVHDVVHDMVHYMVHSTGCEDVDLLGAGGVALGGAGEQHVDALLLDELGRLGVLPLRDLVRSRAVPVEWSSSRVVLVE